MLWRYKQRVMPSRASEHKNARLWITILPTYEHIYDQVLYYIILLPSIILYYYQVLPEILRFVCPTVPYLGNYIDILSLDFDTDTYMLHNTGFISLQECVIDRLKVAT
jgi:hypothetical protein